jgi:NAD(P)-dependent dehydrogenase (short-subunit alcohol dehydrogenase family)
VTDGRLAGQSVLVTGAASGMGRSTTARLVEEGARVTAVDVNKVGLEETERLAAGGHVVTCTADVSHEDDVTAAVDAAVGTFGGLSGVVTCAGIFHPGDLKLAADVTLDDFVHVLGVNLTGTFLAIKYALPHLVKGGGSIVTIASTAALRGHGFGSGYTASKGGVDALTRLVATQYGRQGVRANCICPGGIDTPMTAGRFLTPEAEENFRKRVPVGRVGQPEEIASVAAFLLSDEAAYLSGQTIAVDGASTIAG